MTQLGFRVVVLAVLALPVFAGCDEPYDTLEAEEAEIDEETEIAIAEAFAADPEAASAISWPGLIHWLYAHRWCHAGNDAACGCLVPDGGTCVEFADAAWCLDSTGSAKTICVQRPDGSCHCCTAGTVECEWVEE
jgi:hypothetical protein